jgi:hypothetical protein
MHAAGERFDLDGVIDFDEAASVRRPALLNQKFAPESTTGGPAALRQHSVRVATLNCRRRVVEHMGRDSKSKNAPLGGLASAIDLIHLRYAVAAADHGSFRRVAEALLLRQSAGAMQEKGRGPFPAVPDEMREGTDREG